uniref:RNA-directed DNA polymerase n=1 Tax=Panta errantivirus TaxID=3078412 RepID=A0AB38Z2N6_9VIRU
MDRKMVNPFLPYILLRTSQGEFPFLVDSGANINLITPKMALAYAKSKPYEYRSNGIKSATGDFNASSAIDIAFFEPLSNLKFQFVLYDFHPFFCGIVGTSILKTLNAKLCFEKDSLSITTDDGLPFTIPLQKYAKHKENHFVNFRVDHLDHTKKQRLTNVLNRNKHVFHEPNLALTCTTNVECSINTTDNIPVHQKVYPYPAAYANDVNDHIKNLLETGIIRPSRSAWTSPVWIVPKKDDASGQKKFRMVIDYRKINEKTNSDRYPMPEITYVLDQMKGQKYFSTLDLASGFHQIKMKNEDIEKTAFSINNGKYEFLRMPFGLKNAPAIFQRAIDDVLRNHIGKICYIYMDDVIVFGKSVDEHLENLETILKTLNSANLKIQLDKSEFLHKQIEFLGHIVTDEGIKPNIKKIEAIKMFQAPKTIKQLRSFLGLMGYYRKFIRDYAMIAKPLTNILRGETKISSTKKISLSEEQIKCFDKLKHILSSSDILIYPDYNQPFILTTDASDYAIGAVLSQGELGKDKPIHFGSRTLNKTEESYSVPEKEMLAIIWALKTFRNYLYGAKFKILTDHQPLTFTLSQRNTNAKLKRWKAYLEEHDYEIIYKPGKTNVVADALSRMVYSMTATQHSANESDDFFILSTEAALNVFRHQVILEEGVENVQSSEPFPNFKRIKVTVPNTADQTLLKVLKTHFDPSKLNGLLTSESLMGKLQEIYNKNFGRQNLLKIRFTQKMLQDIPCSNDQTAIIRKEHNRAHRGIEENRAQILRKYYFPKITAKIKYIIHNCQICNECKYDRSPTNSPIQKTPMPNAPFEIIHVDIMFLEKNYFLTCVDKFSKYAQVMKIDSRATVDVFPKLKEAILKHKPPDIIVIDGEKSLNSREITDFFNINGIIPYITATGRSEMNGIVERFHSTLLEIYRISKTEHPHINSLDLVTMSVHKYNHSVHSGTLYTPMEIITPSDDTPVILSKVRINISKKQHKDITYHNKSREDRAISKDSDAYMKTKRRLKHVKPYKKINIEKVNRTTVTTTDGKRIHKNDLKIKKE